MASERPALTGEERALLERVATRVVELRMEVPALLMLESIKPLSLVAGQALVFFEPMAQGLLGFPDYRRFAALVERREALEALASLIEERVARAEAARRTARAPAGSGPAAPPGGEAAR